MLVIITIHSGLDTILNASVNLWHLPFKICGRNLKIHPALRSQLTLSFPHHNLQTGLHQPWGARQVMKVSEADRGEGKGLLCFLTCEREKDRGTLLYCNNRKPCKRGDEWQWALAPVSGSHRQDGMWRLEKTVLISWKQCRWAPVHGCHAGPGFPRFKEARLLDSHAKSPPI